MVGVLVIVAVATAWILWNFRNFREEMADWRRSSELLRELTADKTGRPKLAREAKALWDSSVPDSGQADSVEGELIRAIGRLRDEAHRNGNANWDAGHARFIDLLRTRLTDKKVYSAETIAQTRAHLKTIGAGARPCVDDGPYDQLADRVVEYHRHHGSLPWTRDPEQHR